MKQGCHTIFELHFGDDGWDALDFDVGCCGRWEEEGPAQSGKPSGG